MFTFKENVRQKLMSAMCKGTYVIYALHTTKTSGFPVITQQMTIQDITAQAQLAGGWMRLPMLTAPAVTEQDAVKYLAVVESSYNNGQALQDSKSRIYALVLAQQRTAQSGSVINIPISYVDLDPVIKKRANSAPVVQMQFKIGDNE